MTVWIGLTGGIGSGKSQVAADFSALGVPRIDADAISRQLTQTADSVALQQIRQQFGENAITLSGCLWGGGNSYFDRTSYFSIACAADFGGYLP